VTLEAAPLINLAAFEQGDSQTQQCIAHIVDEACQHTGFLAITNHGISHDITHNVWQADKQKWRHIAVSPLDSNGFAQD
jgi:isopenicillin N synthase-like dioxygenase